jgi:hypothetical protein
VKRHATDRHRRRAGDGVGAVVDLCPMPVEGTKAPGEGEEVSVDSRDRPSAGLTPGRCWASRLEAAFATCRRLADPGLGHRRSKTGQLQISDHLAAFGQPLPLTHQRRTGGLGARGSVDGGCREDADRCQSRHRQENAPHQALASIRMRPIRELRPYDPQRESQAVTVRISPWSYSSGDQR